MLLIFLFNKTNKKNIITSEASFYTEKIQKKAGNKLKQPLFTGACTALITPFKNGKIDYKSLDRIIEFQIDSGIRALVISGTTGEAPTLSYYEHKNLIKHAVKRANGRAKIIAGTGSNDTAKAIKMSKYAEEYGADGLLIVTPYYNKANKEGIFFHYQKINDNTNLPIIVYNVPTRTCVNISAEVYAKLAELTKVCGIKEASSNLSDLAMTASTCPLPIYSGNDDLLLPVLSLGGCGVISVMSNIFPHASIEICKLFECGKIDEARELYFKYLKFSKLLFSDINPIPIKAVMAYAGLCENELRLPMTKAGEACEKMLIEEFNNLTK